MSYWNFEYTKAVIYTVVKVGGGIGQDPATEVTHLRLNQPPVFSSVPKLFSEYRIQGVNKRNSLLSAYCLLSACFFPGFAPG